MTRLLFTVVFACAAACGGHNAPPDLPRADAAPGPFTVQTSVPARGMAEGEFTLDVGGSINVSFSASAELEWNLHTHNEGSTQYLRQGTGAAATYSYIATQQGDHWPMWDNRSDAAVDLEVMLTLGAGATWNGWLPTPAAKKP